MINVDKKEEWKKGGGWEGERKDIVNFSYIFILMYSLK